MPAPFATSNPAEFTRVEGVYINERNPPGFVQGVSLNTMGVFGQCVRGPVDTPVEISSEARFREIFGGRDFTADGSGGTLIGHVWRDLLNKPFGALVVVRAAATAAATASFNAEDTDGGAGTEIISVAATSPGLWGNNVSFKVKDATDGNALHFDLEIKYLGATLNYQNLNTQAGSDNLATVIGDDLGNNVLVTKLADGRPLNNAAFTGAFAAALDSDDFMPLGTVVASFTSVAGTEGTIAATDYTATDRALDQIKEFRGLAGVWCAEDDATITPLVNTAVVAAAAASSDRVFMIWSGDHTDTEAQAITYFDTLTDNDRTINTWNSPFTLDTETAVLIQVPPTAWMASILSQNDVDIHPGEEATKEQTAGISKLTFESVTREQYVNLREAGIAALERIDGFLFVSGVVADLTPGRTEITRRRSTDFLQLSAADRLKFFVKKKGTDANRRAQVRELTDFSTQLKTQSRVLEEFKIDTESVNTPAQSAQGLRFILWLVRLIGHDLFIVLQTDIGTGVTIEVG